MTVSHPRPQFLVRASGPMLRLLQQIARTPVPVVRTVSYGPTLNGLLVRGLVEEAERDGVTVYLPTAAGRREMESALPPPRPGRPIPLRRG